MEIVVSFQETIHYIVLFSKVNYKEYLDNDQGYQYYSKELLHLEIRYLIMVKYGGESFPS